jgi:hypothetical protein
VILNLVLFCLIALTKVWGAQMGSDNTEILLKILLQNYLINMCVTCVSYITYKYLYGYIFDLRIGEALFIIVQIFLVIYYSHTFGFNTKSINSTLLVLAAKSCVLRLTSTLSCPLLLSSYYFSCCGSCLQRFLKNSWILIL